MLNHVALQGRLVSDPELKKSKQDTLYCNFCICSTDKVKNTEQKIFLLCTAWRKAAETVCNNFKKGQEIIVEGKLIQERWERDGVKRSIIKMNVERVNFCGPNLNKLAANEFVIDAMPEEDMSYILPEDFLPF